ncbi:hypothetical protein EQF91_03655 [Helcococcus ovis]|uniref:Pneumococcal-type histidine triad protein n=1 Tax=Helcococcus ovis TaxID=72026 RepID=A0A4R9C1M5_9FIRM|nr:hypothetical protein [Helcococcus ovis]TFF63940.1 hypothetical protein EQF92_07800 [Helcococcus ovis]TFF66558.1 hypothetical protein EQF91_03655 [Helcococcus ovis]
MKKGKFKLVLSLVAALALFTGCGNNKKEQKSPELKKSELKSVTPVFKEKQNKYKNDKTTEVLVDAEIAKENIVKVVKHGDHWHVWTKDGVEHITYTDPNKLQSGKKLSLVSVVSLEKLKEMDVVKILKHGDHWHVYTSDGSEYLTYENPESSFRNVEIGTYVGNHGNNQYSSENYDSNISEELRGSDVVKILKHEDHYHIYTRDGQEFISYSDPRNMYPNAEFGQYVGSHGESNSNGKQNYNTDSKKINSTTNTAQNNSNQSITNDEINEKIKNLNIIGVLGKESVNRFDIVKILQHGNHWHIYDSKNNEGITYVNPQNLYPKARFGEYVGSHADNSNNQNLVKKFDWPEGITKIIDHGDHWHLYRGDEEVTVTSINPIPHYTDVEVIKESNEFENITVNNQELFKYDEVEPVKNVKLFSRLEPNLQSMDNFGNPDSSIPIFGSNGQKENVFYWLHGDHYHAISIKQLIQMEKNGKFGDAKARDVVAVLKYKINNPNEKMTLEVVADAGKVVEFLSGHYNISSRDISKIFRLGNNINIYGKETYIFSLYDFEEKDGKIIYLKQLPKIDGLKEKEKFEEEITEKDGKDKSPNRYKSPEFKPSIEDVNKKSEKEIKNENQKIQDRKDSKLGQNEEKFIPKKENKEIDDKREEENLRKLAKALGISEDDAFDKVYEVIKESPRIADLEVNEDGTVKYKGKIYDLRN